MDEIIFIKVDNEKKIEEKITPYRLNLNEKVSKMHTTTTRRNKNNISEHSVPTRPSSITRQTTQASKRKYRQLDRQSSEERSCISRISKAQEIAKIDEG